MRTESDEHTRLNDREILAKTKFQDWPESPRMDFRRMVYVMGGSITGYGSNGVQVAMPNEQSREHAIRQYAYALGLGISNSGTGYFPLGADDYPRSQRHHYRQFKKDDPGYWYQVSFIPPMYPTHNPSEDK
jgi:hypothetical protein